MKGDDEIRKRIAANSKARADAQAVIELITEIRQGEPKHANEVFGGSIFNLLMGMGFLDLTANQRAQLPMTNEESRRFGAQQMSYGSYAGKRVDEVPLDRLQWYADQRFTSDLLRYLRSDRIKYEDQD